MVQNKKIIMEIDFYLPLRHIYFPVCNGLCSLIDSSNLMLSRRIQLKELKGRSVSSSFARRITIPVSDI